MGAEIYFDNAATSFPKPKSVIAEVKKCIRHYCANPGRSTHRLALEAAEKVFETRERVAGLINTPLAERIIFTSNATHALNIAIKGCIDHKCHVIISDLEHNSVIRPLTSLKNSLGIDISVFNSDLPLEEAIIPLVRSDTEYLISTIASNVTGKIIDPVALGRIADKCSLRLIVDASQFLGHSSLDLEKSPIDIVCAPAHKGLLGIPGCGFLAISKGVEMKTLIEGGSGGDSFNTVMPKNLPERFEAGTLNLPAIVGLRAGIEYLDRIGEDYVADYMNSLTLRLRDVLLDCGANIYGCENGIASFELPGHVSSEVAVCLDDAHIAVRSGLHCAPGVHKKLGTDGRGLVRISLSVFNTKLELDRLHRVLKAI